MKSTPSLFIVNSFLAQKRSFNYSSSSSENVKRKKNVVHSLLMGILQIKRTKKRVKRRHRERNEDVRERVNLSKSH